MDVRNAEEKKFEVDCPSIEIAAFLDGELSPQAESKLESHLVLCVTCSEELNLQKHFLNALNNSLTDAPELPDDFTKYIVKSAESNVEGLRKKNERLSAVFVSVGLLLFVIFTLGAKASGTFASTFGIVQRIYLVVAVAAHVVFDITEGIFIILRTATAQPAIGLPIAVIALFVVTLLTFFISRARSNSRKAQVESGNIF